MNTECSLITGESNDESGIKDDYLDENKKPLFSYRKFPEVIIFTYHSKIKLFTMISTTFLKEMNFLLKREI